MKIKNN